MAITAFNGPYAFLSNFHPFPMDIDGLMFPTIEHAFQACKSAELEEVVRISVAPTPGIAKRMGRKVALPGDWEEVKDEIMRALVRLKFRDPDLRTKLEATGDQELVEGNTWHDQYWGDCTCPQHKDTPGKNMLGKILMEERAHDH